ncbi:flagellin [Roseibium algae]|uniref:Flagellin n=1 Tax=Roseibium algae TaxID=3123038 RepID=A0ABU8TEK0_9HYPH
MSDFAASGATVFTSADLNLADTSALGTAEDSLVLAAGATASLTIGSTAVEIGDANSAATQTFTADQLAEAINTSLAENNNYDYIASADTDGNLVIQTRDDGADASLSLTGFTGVTAADLVITDTEAVGTTVEANTTGADIVVGSDFKDTINLKITELTASSLGIEDLDISTQEGAEESLAVLDRAIDEVSNARAETGATMSRFEFRSTQLETSIENLEAANSSIADVDIASEQAKLSAASVKVQAAVAAASQANEMPENLLRLIQ